MISDWCIAKTSRHRPRAPVKLCWQLEPEPFINSEKFKIQLITVTKVIQCLDKIVGTKLKTHFEALDTMNRFENELAAMTSKIFLVCDWLMGSCHLRLRDELSFGHIPQEEITFFVVGQNLHLIFHLNVTQRTSWIQ